MKKAKSRPRAKPQVGLKPGVIRRQKMLQQMLDAFLADKAKFVPSCAPTQYTTNVYYFVVVKDCEHITEQDAIDMTAGLRGKAQASADAICELNKTCPVARLIGYTLTRNECVGRKWEIDARWTFECTQQ
ncbi:MAG TPA: hypothetical protein VGL31_03960 [Xanthobacteraceae bacterium]|jgi:hypothetical protein